MTSKKLKLDCREDAGEGQETERGNWDELPQEVLDMIFNHLPVPDLLSCSVMSKNWNKASRDVLKRSRECYAHIKHFRQDVQHLNDMIASTDLMQLINGLHSEVTYQGSYRMAAPSSSWKEDSYATLQSKGTGRKLEKAKRNIQTILCSQWKYMKLDMGRYWKELLSVVDALILRELISTASESIQKLVVGQDDDCDFITSWCGKNFSRLKVLHNLDEIYEERKPSLERFVLESAPNLEEITGGMLDVEAHSPANIFLFKRMKSIRVTTNRETPETGFMDGLRSVSGLCRLDLQKYHCHPSVVDGTLFSMVLNSLNTLQDFRMCIVEFYKLFQTSDELKFPNLRRLSLAPHWCMPVEHELSALKRLNLPKLCPNLEHVELCADDYYEHYDEEENPFEGPYGLDQSDRPIKTAYYCRGEWWKYSHEHLKLMNEIYPKMSKVQVLKWRPDQNYEMNSIFSDLHSLEYLEINVFPRRFCRDPDFAIVAILCGINIEEAKFLFSEPEKKNAKFNPCIVPIRPSLFNAKNLKELKITGLGMFTGQYANRSWAIQITENLPVRHVRKLAVNFEGAAGLYRTLNDLRAFRTLLCTQVIGIGIEEPVV